MSSESRCKLGIGVGILLVMVLAFCVGRSFVQSPNGSSRSSPSQTVAVQSLPARPPGSAPPTTPDLAFFIHGGFGIDLIGSIYKQDNGRWYSTTFRALKGMNISAPMNINGQIQEVDTKFMVVDYQDYSNNVQVILRDPTGDLVSRDSATDSANREWVDVMEKVNQSATAAAGTPRPKTPVPVRP